MDIDCPLVVLNEHPKEKKQKKLLTGQFDFENFWCKLNKNSQFSLVRSIAFLHQNGKIWERERSKHQSRHQPPNF